MRDVVFKVFFGIDTLVTVAVGCLFIVIMFADWSVLTTNIMLAGILVTATAIVISGVVLRRLDKPVFANIVLALLAVPTLATAIYIVVMANWPIQRQLDKQPIATVLEDPIEPGYVQGGFGINTCCDQMSLRPWDAGLVVWVRFNSTKLRQTIASCSDSAGTGNAIGSLTGIEMATANCDEEIYNMVLEDNAIIIQKGDVRKRDNIISRIPLPEGTTWTGGNASPKRQFSKPREDLCKNAIAPTLILENGSVKYCSEKPELGPFWEQFVDQYSQQN